MNVRTRTFPNVDFGELPNPGRELACKRLGIVSSGGTTPRCLTDEQAQGQPRLRINFSTEITGKMIAPASALKSSDGRVRGWVEKITCIDGT